ncbi:MAG TPA: MmcQ/YjbR family DNA-binding protein [Firmicutes bacterium]|nr:MmcQ/YjbR family DNA-binding protein [Bacillota bacterium]
MAYGDSYPANPRKEAQAVTPQQVLAYCLSKKGAYIDHPFGPDSTILKVGKTPSRPGRIFAQVFVLKGRDSLTLNCERMAGELYRRLYPGVIVRGYHCPPVQQPYFNTFPLDGAVPDELVREMIDHSYDTVVGKLPKALQRELRG